MDGLQGECICKEGRHEKIRVYKLLLVFVLHEVFESGLKMTNHPPSWVKERCAKKEMAHLDGR